VWNGLYFALLQYLDRSVRVVVTTTKPPVMDEKVWFEIQRGESILIEEGVPIKFSPIATNNL
jgi:hypothetical protein